MKYKHTKHNQSVQICVFPLGTYTVVSAVLLCWLPHCTEVQLSWKVDTISRVNRSLIHLRTCFGQIILNLHTQASVNLQGYQVLKLYTYANSLTSLQKFLALFTRLYLENKGHVKKDQPRYCQVNFISQESTFQFYSLGQKFDAK